MPSNRERKKADEPNRPVTSKQQPLAPQAEAHRRAEELRTRAAQLEIISASWEGPLPNPNDMRSYDEIAPGTAQRLIDMHIHEREEFLRLHIEQTEHRHELESTAVTSNIQNSKRGQYFALVIVLAVIAVSAFAISRNYATQGLAGILSSLAVLAAVFVYGNERAVAELRAKWQAVLGTDPSSPPKDENSG
jgi:uncharacterized membrane protein